MNVTDLVIELEDISKSYSLESRPASRLWNQLVGRNDRGPQHHALHKINLTIRRGEVVGIIGRNGAGKSTLLQVVCGVLQPSAGRRIVRGRVAALLELGAGFNPELTGRENVRLNGPLLGMSADEIGRRMDSIVDFAGIGAFID
ncbi:MAG: ATP-binding cassette domain-containing protein, partial [Chitinophagaceae bacterium]|nr:ATP-binding cassette domain-containing protein [Rubrivivax sp.]